MKVTELKIVPAREGDEDQVYKFLLANFFLDEPMNASMNRLPSKEKFKPLRCVANGHSFLAYAKTEDGQERLVGLLLNEVDKKGEEMPVPLDRDGMKIYLMLSKLTKAFDVWSVATSGEIFHLYILAVSRDCRGLSVGRRLIEQSLKWAAASGFSHAAIECSSHFSAQIVEKMGFEKVCSVRYDEFTDENGEVMFKVAKPHVAIQKYLKKLQEV